MKKLFTVEANTIDEAINKLEKAKENVLLGNLLKSSTEPKKVLTDLVCVEILND